MRSSSQATRGGTGASTSGRHAPTKQSPLRQQHQAKNAPPPAKNAASLRPSSLVRLRGGAVCPAAAASDGPGSKGEPVPPTAKKPVVAASPQRKKAPTSTTTKPLQQPNKPQAAASSSAATAATAAPATTTPNAAAPAPPPQPASKAPAAGKAATAAPAAAPAVATGTSSAKPSAPPPSSSARYAPVDPRNVRNFSIIAHIDHGCVFFVFLLRFSSEISHRKIDRGAPPPGGGE